MSKPSRFSCGVWFFICHLLLVISLISQSACLNAAEFKEAEEGWRYTKTLNLKITCDAVSKEFNLQNMHSSMASLIEQSLPLVKDFDSAKEPKDKVLSIIRFTPIVMENHAAQIQLGNTILLPSTLMNGKAPLPFSPYQEIVFASGWASDYSQRMQKLMVFKDCDSMRTPGKKNKKMFAMLPPFNPEKVFTSEELARYSLADRYSVAVRFLQRIYVSPLLFEVGINFRYPADGVGTIFERGDYGPIKAIHDKARDRIAERKKVIVEDFKNLQQEALELDIVETIDQLEPGQSYSRLEALKKGRYKFHDILAANSYSCAEQTELDYLSDISIIDYLQKTLNIDDPSTKGVIVHIHCSQTPCGTCATSFARECEKGGIFSTISKGKPSLPLTFVLLRHKALQMLVFYWV